jgi:hypothetical protein
MNALISAAVATVALSVGGLSAQALEETDRAIGAGSYVSPNSSDRVAWSVASSKTSHAGAVGARKKR